MSRLFGRLLGDPLQNPKIRLVVGGNFERCKKMTLGEVAGMSKALAKESEASPHAEDAGACCEHGVAGDCFHVFLLGKGKESGLP
jgi:hypothetical protein